MVWYFDCRPFADELIRKPHQVMIAISKYRPRRRVATNCSNPSIPKITNLTLAGLHCCISLFQFFVLPIYLSPRAAGASSLLPVRLRQRLYGPATRSHSRVFNASGWVNCTVGRLLLSVSALLFTFFGSLTFHHKFNRARNVKGTEIYDSLKVSRLRASLLILLYFLRADWLEVASIFIFFVPPSVFHRMRRRLFDQGFRRKMVGRTIYGRDARTANPHRWTGDLPDIELQRLLFGRHWLMFAALLMGLTLLVSLHDNVYHYGMPVGVAVSGHNLFMPKFFATLVLKFHLHRIHHRHPNVPWIELPDYFARQSETYDQNFLIALVNQLCGPIPISTAPERFQSPQKIKSANS